MVGSLGPGKHAYIVRETKRRYPAFSFCDKDLLKPSERHQVIAGFLGWLLSPKLGNRAKPRNGVF